MRIASVLVLLTLTGSTASAQTPPSFLLEWGGFGNGDGQFVCPWGVATDPAGNVYVADQCNNQRIQKFTAAGIYITQWGSFGSGDRQFANPYGVAVDPAGNVYVADLDNNRIQKFTSTGTYLTQWGSPGSGNGQLNLPFGVGTDAAGNVYVVDLGNRRIQKFTSTGTYLTQWGSPGSDDGQFEFPRSLATDAAGNVYVVDSGNNRIQKFTDTGTYLTQWGSPGSGDGQFNGPSGAATDAAGNVYVTDTGNHRIQKFTSAGAYLTQWGSLGAGDGQFYEGPQGVATDASGNIFVVDAGHYRVQKFGGQTPDLELDVDLDPNVINLASRALWVTAYLEPSGFDPESIDISTLRLAGSVPAVSKFAIIGDHNRNGIPDLMLKFSRVALDPLLQLAVNSLEVTGLLVTGESFTGTGEVRVIDSGRGFQTASVSPNPLNPSGVLAFTTVKSGNVRVTMFDLQGRLVRTLMETARLPAGEHKVRIDGRGLQGDVLPSGVYFYRIDSPDGASTGHFAVLK